MPKPKVRTALEQSSAGAPGGRRRTIWFVVLIGVIAGLFGIAGSSPVAAQDDGDDSADTTEATASESIGGQLRTRTAEGEDVFVEGVTMTVFAEDGTEVGFDVSDAEGLWRVALPGPGFYDVELDEATLPEDVPLREEGRNRLEAIEVKEGDEKNTLFPLGEALESTDNTILIVQLIADGIKLGLIIAMCSIGLSLIYGTTGLTNFAHGEMVTFGAMAAFVVHMVYPDQILGIPGTNSLIFAGIVTIFLGGAAGWALNKFVWRPLRQRGASLIAALVVSIGMAIFFRYVFLYQFGGRARFYRDYQIQEKIDFGIFRMAPKDIFIVVFSTLVLIGVGLALQKTRAGKAMRAVADNRDLAESSGIDVEAVIKWVWITGSALAALGGVLFGMTESVNWEMGFRLLLLMFAGVTLGGLGTAYGALFGSLIVGVFIQVIAYPSWFPSDMKNVGALGMLVIILLIRPQGLLGRKERIG